MKKRLMCLALSLIMVMSVFLAGCSKDKETKDESKSPITLTLRVISEKKVYTDEELKTAVENGSMKVDSAEYADAVATKESYAAVEAAISALTEEKFRTRLNIVYLT